MYLKKIMVALLLTVGVAASAHAVKYYRYVDDSGVTVLSRQGVPAEHIAKGYDVLNEHGRVVRTVPRAPTAAEHQQMQEERKQAEYDRHLLRLYSTPHDVDRARERKLTEINGLAALVQGNLHSVSANKADLLRKAANMERSGKDVPADLLRRIDEIEQDEARYQQDLLRYAEKIADIKQSFAQDKQRVIELLGKK